MRGISRLVALLVPFLLVAGCGGGSSTAKTEESTPKIVRVESLEAAFASAQKTSSYRFTQSSGQTFKSSALGVDNAAGIDSAKPGMTGEVTPESQHFKVQVARVLGALPPDIPDVAFEVWSDDRRLVIDSRSYAELQKAQAGIELGPFEPGISSIDLDAVGDRAPDLRAAIVGQGFTDLATMATELPKVLEGVKQNGSTFTGTAKYADLINAMGGDVNDVARGLAAGVALNLQVDAADLAKLYVDYYEQLDADVTIKVDDGVVQSVAYEADLSGLFDYMFKHADALGFEGSAEDLKLARDALADTVLIVEALITFEPVEDLELPVAPTPTDDRTDEWISLLQGAR